MRLKIPFCNALEGHEVFVFKVNSGIGLEVMQEGR